MDTEDRRPRGCIRSHVSVLLVMEEALGAGQSNVESRASDRSLRGRIVRVVTHQTGIVRRGLAPARGDDLAGVRGGRAGARAAERKVFAREQILAGREIFGRRLVFA